MRKLMLLVCHSMTHESIILSVRVRVYVPVSIFWDVLFSLVHGDKVSSSRKQHHADGGLTKDNIQQYTTYDLA